MTKIADADCRLDFEFQSLVLVHVVEVLIGGGWRVL
jgi:hypothetical protein